MAKQSIADRLLRLSEGRCPIHGIDMMPIDGWYWADTGESIYCSESWEGRISCAIVECLRRDCNIRAISYSFDCSIRSIPYSFVEPCELTNEWKHLIQRTDKVIPFPKLKQPI